MNWRGWVVGLTRRRGGAREWTLQGGAAGERSVSAADETRNTEGGVGDELRNTEEGSLPKQNRANLTHFLIGHHLSLG